MKDLIEANNHAFLVGLVKKQAAKLEAVKVLADSWDEYPSSPEGRCARELLNALEEA